MPAECNIPNTRAVLDCARLPIAVMNGVGMTVCYVNLAFCDLTGKSEHEMVGRPFSTVMPDRDSCLLLLDKVYSSGRNETHTEHLSDKAHPFYWSYDIWPTWAREKEGGIPIGVVLQITETAPLHRRAAVVNEALLLSSVRQHVLIEESEMLNRKLIVEIRERERVEREIEQLAFYDPLTELPNRRLLLDRLHHAIVSCRRTLNYGAILFIDLDHFKELNDTQGHHLGDLLLQQTGQRLRRCVREDDTVARLGGDEFVVMLQGLSGSVVEATAQAKSIASKILELLNQPYLLETSHHQSSGSIGIALFDKEDGVVEELLTRADLAQYRAKSAGGGAFRFFDPDMQAKAESRAALERDLRKAISKGQLRLHYQPQVDDAGHITGCEGLLRWEHPEKGLLYPMDFIVSAEEHGIIESIGFWVIETACKQLMKWSFKPATSQLTLAVNVSAREFGHPDFVSRTKMILEESGADPSKLTLEFTERVMFGPLAETLSKMSTLGALGLAFALDDFGMGFSSLACLRTLPLSQLKLDRSFICDILTNPSDGLIVTSVIDLGRSLGMSVIAEGVETQEQWQFLSDHGCRMYQGYLFGRPAPLEQLSFGLEQQTIVKRVN